MPVAKLFAIGALIAFELIVVGLALSPRVDARYEAVFIDRTSECWLHPVSGEIAFDQRISMLGKEKALAEEARAVLRCGWLNPEGKGIWSVGPESRLLLRLPPDQAATLDMELKPFWHTQRIDITANGEPLTQWTLPTNTTQRNLRLPATKDGKVELAFHFHDAISPRELGLLADRRGLAITLNALTLRKD